MAFKGKKLSQDQIEKIREILPKRLKKADVNFYSKTSKTVDLYNSDQEFVYTVDIDNFYDALSEGEELKSCFIQESWDITGNSPKKSII